MAIGLLAHQLEALNLLALLEFELGRLFAAAEPGVDDRSPFENLGEGGGVVGDWWGDTALLTQWLIGKIHRGQRGRLLRHFRADAQRRAPAAMRPGNQWSVGVVGGVGCFPQRRGRPLFDPFRFEREGLNGLDLCAARLDDLNDHGLVVPAELVERRGSVVEQLLVGVVQCADLDRREAVFEIGDDERVPGDFWQDDRIGRSPHAIAHESIEIKLLLEMNRAVDLRGKVHDVQYVDHDVVEHLLADGEQLVLAVVLVADGRAFSIALAQAALELAGFGGIPENLLSECVGRRAL